MQQNIEQQLSQQRPLLLMFDYDGTLTPIVPHPSEAQIKPEEIAVLAQLSERKNTILAIISGRAITQLNHFLNHEGHFPIFLCGLHGGEICKLPDQKYFLKPHPQLRQTVANLYQSLSQFFDQDPVHFKGIYLENKQFSLALHYRHASATAKEKALTYFHQIIQTIPQNHLFKIQTGKKVEEFLPITFSKANSVHFLREYVTKHYGVAPMMVYFGDDRTDEEAFLVVNAYGGLSYFIGEPEYKHTCAQAKIENCTMIYDILRGLAETGS